MAVQPSYQSPDLEERISRFEDIDISLTYNYSHYLNRLFDDRVELIAGKILKMSPAPTPLHQQISVHIASILFNFLKNKPFKVYTTPFDVRFPV